MKLQEDEIIDDKSITNEENSSSIEKEVLIKNLQDELTLARLKILHLEENEKDLLFMNKELVLEFMENEKLTAALSALNQKIVIENIDKEKKAEELIKANKELAFQNEEKQRKANELNIANIELAFQNTEKEKRAIELSTANKELQSFTYVSSHDLQEPLRKIQMLSTRILEKENERLSSYGKDYFNRIQIAASRMQKLIEDLLAFSRLNTAERAFEKIDLNTLVNEVKEELKETIDEKKATINYEVLGKISVIPFQFRQLLFNLIGNSLKFSKTTIQPIITIKSEVIQGSAYIQHDVKLLNHTLDIQKNYYHISIADNGIGFEPQYNERIFEVFQRLHGKETYKGTGIGLAIVKKIVENHNGIITANGKLNLGATFDIYIPEN